MHLLYGILHNIMHVYVYRVTTNLRVILYVTGYGKISFFVTREVNKTEHFAMLP